MQQHCARIYTTGSKAPDLEIWHCQLQERLEVEPLSVSKPPFGKDATVAAALACAAHDPSCAAAACDLQAALAAYVSMAKDREWGRALAPAAAAIVGALPHATAASEVCQWLAGPPRCVALRQAVAMLALARLLDMQARPCPAPAL